MGGVGLEVIGFGVYFSEEYFMDLRSTQETDNERAFVNLCIYLRLRVWGQGSV